LICQYEILLILLRTDYTTRSLTFDVSISPERANVGQGAFLLLIECTYRVHHKRLHIINYREELEQFDSYHTLAELLKISPHTPLEDFPSCNTDLYNIES